MWSECHLTLRHAQIIIRQATLTFWRIKAILQNVWKSSLESSWCTSFGSGIYIWRLGPSQNFWLSNGSLEQVLLPKITWSSTWLIFFIISYFHVTVIRLMHAAIRVHCQVHHLLWDKFWPLLKDEFFHNLITGVFEQIIDDLFCNFYWVAHLNQLLLELIF